MKNLIFDMGGVLIRYDPETVLLIDSWKDQAAIDAHHASSMMATIAALKEKYDLHMTVERYMSAEGNTDDGRFI